MKIKDIEAIRAAKTLKQYCRETSCPKCIFYCVKSRRFPEDVVCYSAIEALERIEMFDAMRQEKTKMTYWNRLKANLNVVAYSILDFFKVLLT